MTFFYDLNKKLDSIREKPETTHKQLNERDEGKPGKNFEKIAKSAGERYGSKAAGERVAGAVRNKLKSQGKLEEEGMSRAAKGYEKYGKQGMEALAKAGREGKSLDPVRKKYDKYDEGIEDRLKDLDPKNPVNIPAYQRKAAEQGRPVKEATPMSSKQKKFAALAEPKDKITFADKIAGAKKEVDEMLGDVAAEAMKAALSPKQKKIDMNKNGKLDANDFAMLRKGGKQETDEGWDDMLKDLERRRNTPKVGDVRHGSKHDVEEIPGGRRVTRRTDPNTGYSVGTDDDTPASGEKRGRGRPKGSKAALGAKGPSGKSKLMTKEAGHDQSELKAAAALLKKAGYKVTKVKTELDELSPQTVASYQKKAMPQAADASDPKSDQRAAGIARTIGRKTSGGEKELDEKAVSKKQQRFMGMVHATQKGEKAPSKEVAKVAKSMGKKDAEDFAATKHKGLPEKKKPEGKKKEKTEEAGGTGTPTASSGFGFGKGIYDSMNHELESMIAEGMNVSMSMNSDAQGGPSKSLTVTATDDDALKLSQLLKNAGLGGGDDHGYGGTGYKSACGCGTPDCSCGEQEMDEAYGDNSVSQNKPNWPTNTETSDDALQYSGGLNKPKSTGQTTVPVIASQEERQESYAAEEEAAIKRMMEMAGMDEGVHTTLSTYRVKGQDLIDYLSNESGAEMEVHDGPDGPVGILTVDNITFPQLSRLAGKLATEKKIQPIAGPATRDMTGKATTVGTKYIQSPEVAEGDDLARMMEMAGVKKKTDEEKTEEGNLFTGNLAKARADGKKQADLDGDGKMEKVDEGILSATASLWTQYKGKYGV